MIAEKLETSSIGPKWPPAISSFDRLKGFYDAAVIDDLNVYHDLLDEVKGFSTELLLDAARYSRISIRAVVRNRIIQEDDYQRGGSPILEAVVPLAGSAGALAEYSIAYLGLNASSRRSDPTDVKLRRANYQLAMQKSVKSAADIATRAAGEGYRVDIMQATQSEQDLAGLFDLYKKFGWDLGQVAEILSNPNNTIATARYGDQIVSAGIAERSNLKIGTGTRAVDLRLVELTEASTLEEHQGKGLYSSVATRLLIELVSRPDELPDLVYGESNGASLGVLMAVKGQGRMFASEVSADWGIAPEGVLRQHVPIQGAPRQSVYNDLYPSFMTTARVLEFVNS